MKNEEVTQNFIIIEEKDGSHSAILKFANFPDKKQAEALIDEILSELGLYRVDGNLITYH